MKLQNAILKTTYRSETSFKFLNFLMVRKALSQNHENYTPTANMTSVLTEESLELVEAGFFRNKDTVARVKDAQGNRYILKTGGIESLQVRLSQVAKELENDLSFKVPTLVRQGVGWILFQEITGKPLDAFLDEQPGWYVATSKQVADDYQIVLRELQKTHSLGDVLIDGKTWFLSRLNLWSKPIVDAGLIDFSLVQQLQYDFEQLIVEKGESVFGWAHGNIIGDHMIVSGKDVYLLDLNAVPRIGKGYHDFLRALDFLILKAEDHELIGRSIPRWIQRYLPEFDESEVRLVFAFRNVGILGWDVLHHQAEYVSGDLEKKKDLMLKFIRREW